MLLLMALLAVAPAVWAQDSIPIPPSRSEALEQGAHASASLLAAATAPGGVVRVLDKINGTVTDLEIRNGETTVVGSLSVTMGECRYPSDNPAGDAFELVSIRTVRDEVAVFEGWMIASAPALNALDHPRYDVWAIHCMGVTPLSPPAE
jgi:hypothetical protein